MERVSAAARKLWDLVRPGPNLLCGFINDDDLLSQMTYLGAYVMFKRTKGHPPVTVEWMSKRRQIKLHHDVKECLQNLLNGTGLEKVQQRLNQFNPKPMQIRIAPHNTELEFGWDFHVRKQIRIGKKLLTVAAGVPTKPTLDGLLYGALRDCLLSGEIERIGVCQECGNLNIYRTKRKKFCNERCRWKHNNHSRARKERYVKGKWYPYS